MGSSSKKTKVKLDLLTDMFLMIKKGISTGICHSIYKYANNNKANNKYMRDYDKMKTIVIFSMLGRK